ncbi:MAG: hypothetical protein WC179_07945 [Candidatus Cloacimonadaceae bacterium]
MIVRQFTKDDFAYTIYGVQTFENLIEVTVYQDMEPICQYFVPDYAAKQVIKSIQEYISKTTDVTIAGIEHVFQVFQDKEVLDSKDFILKEIKKEV